MRKWCVLGNGFYLYGNKSERRHKLELLEPGTNILIHTPIEAQRYDMCWRGHANFYSQLVRPRHKLHKPSNDAAFERLKDWLFCRKSPHVLGLHLVCDAVVLGRVCKYHM